VTFLILDKTAEVRIVYCDKTTDMLSIVCSSIATRVYCDKTAEVRFIPVHICFAVMKLD